MPFWRINMAEYITLQGKTLLEAIGVSAIRSPRHIKSSEGPAVFESTMDIFYSNYKLGLESIPSELRDDSTDLAWPG